MMLLLALLGCGGKAPAVPAATPSPARPKNVVLIIGDGMGPQQVGLLQLYARKAPGRVIQRTAFDRMAETGRIGLSMHFPGNELVTDSACSATQLATGVPSLPETLGVDLDGAPTRSVLEVARERGLATGLVSDTRITHATPGGFVAHVRSRGDELDIAGQVLEAAPDVMLSGGWRAFVPRSVDGSRRTDDVDLLSRAEAAGYAVVRDAAGLEQAGDRVLGLFAPGGMMDAITERSTRDAPDRTEPSLTQMATAALTRLDADEDGFFVMIESGQIDWAAHENDAGWLLHEMLRADEMLHAVLDFAERDGETLVIVTADHETGGFGVSYSRHAPPAPRPLEGAVFADVPYAPASNYGDPAVLDRLFAQSAPLHDLFDDAETAEALSAAVGAHTAFTLDPAAAARVFATHPDPLGEEAGPIPAVHDFPAFYEPTDYALTALLARELSTEQQVVWATGTHTHTPVPVFAVGPGADAFARLQHHTDIGSWLVRWASGTE